MTYFHQLFRTIDGGLDGLLASVNDLSSSTFLMTFNLTFSVPRGHLQEVISAAVIFFTIVLSW